MNTAAPANPYKHHRIPAEIISHAVWLYDRFCLSDRDIEELLCARGVTGRTKPSGRSVARVANPVRMRSGIDIPDLATRGIWRRFP